MELSPAGLAAARRTRGVQSSPRSVQTKPVTIEQIIEAYLTAAAEEGFETAVQPPPPQEPQTVVAAHEPPAPDEYVLDLGENLYIDGTRIYNNGTQVITLKTRTDGDG